MAWHGMGRSICIILAQRLANLIACIAALFQSIEIPGFSRNTHELVHMSLFLTGYSVVSLWNHFNDKRYWCYIH